MQIEGELAQRQLLNEINLPSLPYNDVIAPSKVQALVDAAGNVVSTVLAGIKRLHDAADQRALEVARACASRPRRKSDVWRTDFQLAHRADDCDEHAMSNPNGSS